MAIIPFNTTRPSTPSGAQLFTGTKTLPAQTFNPRSKIIPFSQFRTPKVAPAVQKKVGIKDVAREIPGAVKESAKGLVKGIVNPFVRLGATADALSTSKFLGGKGAKKEAKIIPFLGEVKPIQNARDAAGVGLELASLAIGGGTARKVSGQLAKDAYIAALRKGVLGGGASGAVGGFGYGLQDENPTAKSLLGSTALGAAAGALFGGAFSKAGQAKKQAQKMVDDFTDELILRGVDPRQARQMATEGGFLNIKSPRVKELQVKWAEIQKAKLNTQNKPAINRYSKAQKQIEDEIWREQQGGFIKNPFRTEPSASPAQKGQQADIQTPQTGRPEVFSKSSSYEPSVGNERISVKSDPLTTEARTYKSRGGFIEQKLRDSLTTPDTVMDGIKRDTEKLVGMPAGAERNKLQKELSARLAKHKSPVRKSAEEYGKIWDDANKTTRPAQDIAPKADDLVSEARKYKSAEEFVKGGIFSEARDSGSRNVIRKELSSQTTLKNINDIKVNPNNPALDKSTVQIKLEDIQSGKKPYVLIDDKGQLIDGHHTFEAYKQAGIDKVPTVTKFQLTDIWNKANKPAKSPTYNLARLNIDDAAKGRIEKEISTVGKRLEKVTGSRLSNKEVTELAETSSAVLKKTVTKEQTAAKIATNLKLRQQIAKVAQDGKIDKDFIGLWLKDKSAATDIARQLQARKIKADPQEAQAIDAILEGIYKVNKNADEIQAAAAKVDFDDPKQVAEFYRAFVKPKLSDWVDLLRYNSMLSSPNTHIVNAASNFQGTGLLAPIEKTITGMIDATRAALTGTPRKHFAGEGAEFAKGYYSNLKTATVRFTDVMRGKVLNANPDTRQIPLATKGIKKGVEKALVLPTRLLEASDQFFTALTEGGAKRALDYKASKGAVGSMSASEEAAKRLFRSDTLLPEQGTVLNAIDSITNTINQLRNSDNAVTSTIAKFTFPFIRTPMNIFKQGIEYSPLGFATLYGASNKEEQLAKIVIGLASATGAATLLGSDRLSWAEPTGAKEKARFKAAGKQAYSIKIGDKWFSYSKLHPAVAFNVALVASIDSELKNQTMQESEADSILSGLAKWGNFLADQSYLKSMGELVAASKGDVEGITRYLANYPTQLIPYRALLSWVNRIIDPVQRQIDTDGSILSKQLQAIMMQLPVLSGNVPERKDPEGYSIKTQHPWLNAFSPVRVSTENAFQSKLQQEEQELKLLKKEAQLARDAMKATIEPIYEKTQQLIEQGNVTDAQDLVESLSDEEYEVYKSIKQAKKAQKTRDESPTMIDKYREIQDLLAQGDRERAQQIVDAMTDDEYRAYKSLKTQVKGSSIDQ